MRNDDGKVLELLLLRMPKTPVRADRSPSLTGRIRRAGRDLPLRIPTLTTDDIIPGRWTANMPQPKVEILNLHHAIELMG